VPSPTASLRQSLMPPHEPPASPIANPAPVITAKAEPSLPSPEAEAFYTTALQEFVGLGLPFLLAGTYAVSAYTGISRPTKDLDVFCRPGDFPRILGHFQKLGYG
jgi:hypothetical protein